MARARDRPAFIWMMRIFLGLNLLSAIGFIVYALILENPPKTALPLGMLIIGCVGMAAVVVGLLGTLRADCCLTIYMWLGCLLTLAELGITLAMFFNYKNILDQLYKSNDAKASERKSIAAKVSGGRWFFLVVCCLQFVGVLAAIIFKMCGRAREFESFEDGAEGGANTNSQIQMQKLQSSINGRQTHNVSTSPGTAAYASTKLNKSTTQKMAAKYGEYTSEFKQKGFFSRAFGK